MADFPTLRSGAVTRYGAVRERVHRTEVVQFCDDSEQRWKRKAPEAAFTLALTDLDGYDLSNVLEFFRSMKGRNDKTWNLVLNAVTYPNCAFAQDNITWQEARPELFTLSLRCRQVRA